MGTTFGEKIDGAPLSADQQDERDQLAACERQMDELARQFPDWYAFYEDASPDNAPRAELVALLSAAPSPFAKGLVYGKFTMRLEIAAITGREFQ